MTTDSLTHQLARALASCTVMTKLQEDIKFTALENYFNHYKRFNTSLDGDVIDDSPVFNGRKTVKNGRKTVNKLLASPPAILANPSFSKPSIDTQRLDPKPL